MKNEASEQTEWPQGGGETRPLFSDRGIMKTSMPGDDTDIELNSRKVWRLEMRRVVFFSLSRILLMNEVGGIFLKILVG